MANRFRFPEMGSGSIAIAKTATRIGVDALDAYRKDLTLRRYQQTDFFSAPY
jgi:hypothetical protein